MKFTIDGPQDYSGDPVLEGFTRNIGQRFQYDGHGKTIDDTINAAHRDGNAIVLTLASGLAPRIEVDGDPMWTPPPHWYTEADD